MPASTFQRPATSTGNASSTRPEVPGVWSFYDQLDRTQWLSPEEIEQRQLEEIRALLEHCRQHVPYYSRQLREVGVEPRDIRTLGDFRRLPITSRQTWQEHAAELQATQLPLGTVRVAKSRTSGTSGVPLEVLQTNVVQYWWWACLLRDLEWSHIDPLGDLASIRSPRGSMSPAALRDYYRGVSLPTWFPDLAGLMESGSLHAMDVRQRPEQQLAWLRSVSPNYLLSYPSNLDVLGDLVRDSGQRLPRLRAIQAISETLRPEVRLRIEEAFGVPVKSIYSCAEAGFVASECPDEEGLHVHAEHVLVEVLDARGEPCAPGETGRVVLTAFHNYLNPFIRYEIQDQVTLAPQRCPCGRGLPLLTDVHGKARPMFHLPGGGMKSSNEMVFGLYDTGGYRQHQVIQRALDQVILRIVPNNRWTAEHPERLSQVVRKFFEGPVNVEVNLVDRIEPTANGKVYDMICELPAKFARPAARSADRSAGRSELRDGTKTVLLGWELGSGVGHVHQLLPLARVLASHGVRVVFAVRDMERAGTLVRSLGFPVLQAPVFVSRQDRLHPFVTSYSDILGRNGFDTVENLAPLVNAWQEMLDGVQPDLVVADHSPALCLTTWGVLPTLMIGHGYCVPPSSRPDFPKLLLGNPPEYSDEQLLHVMQEVQRARNRMAPDTVPGLFARAERLVTTLPDIDPYFGERTELIVGPLEQLGQATLPVERPSYFAYLDAEFPGVDAILAGLLLSGIPGQAYLHNLSPEQRRSWQRPDLEILSSPPRLTEVLPGVSAVVHHASGGTAQHALAVGRPQLVFPSRLDQILTGQMLHRLGVGNYVLKDLEPQAIARELQTLIRTPHYTEQAWSRACELQTRGVCNGLPEVLARCLSLLNKPRVANAAAQ